MILFFQFFHVLIGKEGVARKLFLLFQLPQINQDSVICGSQHFFHPAEEDFPKFVLPGALLCMPVFLGVRGSLCLFVCLCIRMSLFISESLSRMLILFLHLISPSDTSIACTLVLSGTNTIRPITTMIIRLPRSFKAISSTFSIPTSSTKPPLLR